jgi:hypothetical protein
MRLYYMTSLETLEAHILPSNRIKVSTFDTVNDPFELLSISCKVQPALQRSHINAFWLSE